MNASTTPAAEAPADQERRLLHRLVLPREVTPDIIPLYVVREAARSGVSSATMGLGQRREDAHAADKRASQSAQVDLSGLDQRHSISISAGEMRSFGTYFNAFPASYWRRWTPVRAVRLTIRAHGSGQIVVYRSNARGSIQRQDHAVIDGAGEAVFDLPLTAFGDGGWYWFDAYAGPGALAIESAEWTADAALARTHGTFSIAMTTMNKVEYCLENIRTLADDQELRELLDVMYVVDQGSDRLHDHADDLAPLQEAMGGQLRIIEQGNIGGSGGFSRGMYEAATAGTSTYVMNCDDDIVIEPESFLRMMAFADFASKPMIVGGHMFDLNNRSVLHTFGEVVDPWRIQPALPHSDGELGHDFAQEPLMSTPWLHRRADVDYNGWWCCLIPTETVRSIGLSLPVFIKWDDAEYGLRAKKAGYPTVSLPGAGVWHVAWGDKDDLVGWQAYFHERNRLITALLHSPYERGGRVIRESQYMDIKHLISMQYFTETGRLRAQQDLLAGPDALHPSIGTVLPEIRAMSGDFADSVSRPDPEAFPEVKRDKPPRRGRDVGQPQPWMLPVWTVRTVARQLMRPAKDAAQAHPEAQIPHQDARWWRLAHYDSALVSNAEGTAVSWYKRDPEAVRRMLGKAVAAHVELLRRWPELRDQYRGAAQRITSFEAWEKTFAENPAPVRDRDRADAASTEGQGSRA